MSLCPFSMSLCPFLSLERTSQKDLGSILNSFYYPSLSCWTIWNMGISTLPVVTQVQVIFCVYISSICCCCFLGDVLQVCWQTTSLISWSHRSYTQWSKIKEKWSCDYCCKAIVQGSMRRWQPCWTIRTDRSGWFGCWKQLILRLNHPVANIKLMYLCPFNGGKLTSLMSIHFLSPEHTQCFEKHFNFQFSTW